MGKQQVVPGEATPVVPFTVEDELSQEEQEEEEHDQESILSVPSPLKAWSCEEVPRFSDQTAMAAEDVPRSSEQTAVAVDKSSFPPITKLQVKQNVEKQPSQSSAGTQPRGFFWVAESLQEDTRYVNAIDDFVNFRWAKLWRRGKRSSTITPAR